jgi:hypothetical protein
LEVTTMVAAVPLAAATIAAMTAAISAFFKVWGPFLVLPSGAVVGGADPGVCREFPNFSEGTTESGLGQLAVRLGGRKPVPS